jgi:transcriptional regulator GlxA family with amidase domain
MSPVQSVQSILFLCYPSCGEQDTLAPWEMLKSLAWVMSQRNPDQTLDVALGAFDDRLVVHPNMTGEREVTMQMGGEVDLERDITPDTRADVLYVPGGIGSGEATRDSRILDLIRAHDDEGRWVVTNCSGTGLLHRAGIVRDTPVTSAATISRKLAREGVDVRTPRTMWLCVPDRRVFTAAGGSAVHPSTIALVWYLFGEELALTLSMMWDSLGAHGRALFELEGPAYGTYPDLEGPLQDEWEDRLMPDAVVPAAAT